MPTNLRQAVLVVDVPESFQPQRPWELPPTIASGELFIKNVTLDSATGFAQCYNKRAMQLHLAERKWALVVRLSKFEWQVEEQGSAATAEDQQIEAAEELGREAGRSCGTARARQANAIARGEALSALDNQCWDFRTFAANIGCGLQGHFKIKPPGKNVNRRAYERGFLWGFEEGIRDIVRMTVSDIFAEIPPSDSAGTRLPNPAWRPGRKEQPMASITKEPNGRRTVQFVGADGKRRSIRLGKVSEEFATEARMHVGALVAAAGQQTSPKPFTLHWLAGLPADLRRRLHAAGLVAEPKEERADLDGFLADYLDRRRHTVRPRTDMNCQQTRKFLVRFFGADRLLVTITPGDADEFQLDLAGKLGPNTVRRHCARAKQFFRAAVRKGLIQRNPFADLKDCSVKPNEARDYHVKPEEAQRVLDACPDAQWRALFALARFGGLRVPSEILPLTWQDVEWERGRLRVTSPETAHQGKASQTIPLFPELKRQLEELFNSPPRPRRSDPVIIRWRGPTASLGPPFEAIIRNAGLTPWPKLWQNLRRTRETELAASFPLHVVCAWIGNTRAVALRHYLRVTEADFAKAVAEPARAAQGGALFAASDPIFDASQTSMPLGGPAAGDGKALADIDLHRLASRWPETPQARPAGPDEAETGRIARAGVKVKRVAEGLSAPAGKPRVGGMLMMDAAVRRW